jgi:glycogen operon protein
MSAERVAGPGRPWPLGVSLEPAGDAVNVAVHSAHATRIALCLFDETGTRETARIALPARTGDVHHGRIEGPGAGRLYGLRAEGPWQPGAGHRFNPAKLLLDPYAREIVGEFEWRDEHRGADPADPERPDPRDNAAHALKARIPGPDRFDWGDDRAPCVPMSATVIYEAHVKGFSRLNPALPEPLRGTFAGLAHPASIAHLRHLGVTTLCLLPVHHHLDEKRLRALGLVNYWGYNTIGFFCADPRLASGAAPPRDEFRSMVKALHAAGIEVVLDVVYNHSAESEGVDGCLSFQGLDNAGYYRLDAADPRRYENHTGCGNTLDIRDPGVLRLVMDSLRFWAGEMRVDGFRFDLATVLGRGDHGFDARGAFFAAVAQDPLLARVKLIAEPWDLGPGGYRVGGFPSGWSEWNDRFRDDVRGYWLRGLHTRAAFAQRLCGSADLFRDGGRPPSTSINYVVSHDGFTLRDLVSYDDKRNEANGEDNRDGTPHNFSVNCGVEGETADPAVLAQRGRLRRALLATLLFAQGVPMIAAGDEIGHTQRGNNNPYCQDNAITWLDWASADADLLAFAARAVALRRDVLRWPDRWAEEPDAGFTLSWDGGDGRALDAKAWDDAGHRALGCLIVRPERSDAETLDTAKPDAPRVLLLFNASDHDLDFVLPDGRWHALLDSADPRGATVWRGDGPALPFPLRARCVALLRSASGAAAADDSPGERATGVPDSRALEADARPGDEPNDEPSGGRTAG